jgi:FkbM family methyltransferase
VLASFGYTYPLTIRLYPTFNAPLLEIVHEVYRLKGRSVSLVDVGAAIGDTVLLVESNCPDLISDYVCVDGDPEFFEYLKTNLSFLKNVRCILVQLSRLGGLGASLVRIHAGTASAQGAAQVKTSTLDEVLATCSVGPIDVLKIDVDGFDGEVLSGAMNILQKYQPCVIFEWHPILCAQTGNDWHEAFKSLIAAGYDRFIWFTKFGTFSHFMFRYHQPSVEALANHCLSDVPEDRHYDIVALHDSCQLDVQGLVNLKFSANRRAPV